MKTTYKNKNEDDLKQNDKKWRRPQKNQKWRRPKQNKNKLAVT